MTTSVLGDPAAREISQIDRAPVRDRLHRRVLAALGAACLEHRALLAITAAFSATQLMVGPILGPGALGELWHQNILLLAMELSWLVLLAAPLYYRLQARDEAGRRVAGFAGWRTGWRLARAHALSGPRVVGYALSVVALLLTLQTFLAWKSAIPRLHPFDWDPALHRADVWLHLGRTPDAWLQPLLGFPALTSAIDLGYHSLWMYLLVGFMLWQAVRAPGPGRRQALLSFVLMWILLGTVAATMFASAGPVYYGRVAGAGAADPYAPLVAYLHGAQSTVGPLLSLRIQEFLWAGYLHGGRPFGTGISAFPSLHIASTVWFALCAGQRSRRFGAAMWGLVLFMLVGSVVLGWHYAIDGYVAVFGTLGIWVVCGRRMRSDQGSGEIAPR